MTTASLTVLYTVSLRGQLTMLPRLYSLIRRERESLQTPGLLFDLGESCTPDVWLCEASAGRAMLVAMDSMGYDAFHLGAHEPLAGDPLTLGKLRDTMLTPVLTPDRPLALSKGDAAERVFNISVISGEMSAPPTDRVFDLSIRLEHGAEQVSASSNQVLLVDQWTAPSLMLGRLDLIVSETAPRVIISAHQRQPVPPDFPADPTISSVIEFVESEARYVTRKKQV